MSDNVLAIALGGEERTRRTIRVIKTRNSGARSRGARSSTSARPERASRVIGAGTQQTLDSSRDVARAPAHRGQSRLHVRDVAQGHSAASPRIRRRRCWAREKAILMLTDEDGLLRVRAAYGVSDEVVERFRESFDESLITRLTGLLGAGSPDGFIGVPLVVGGNVTGLLAVVRPRARGATIARATPTTSGCSRRSRIRRRRRWRMRSSPSSSTSAKLLAENARLYEAERAARKEAEAARAEAENANRAKSEFLANMSHELRTPLNAIAGYVELLDMEIRGPIVQAQRDDLARIKASQRVLLRLVNDVLNFAKLESGHVPVTVKDVNIAQVFGRAGAARAAAADVEGAALRHRFVLGRAARGGGCREARADPAQPAVERDQVHAGGWVDPSDVRVDGRDRAHSSVADTGRGIPQEKQDRIFEPFVRVDEGFARKTEGTGLGLAISRNLARAMGGELAVESTPGAGATFTLTLKRSAVSVVARGRKRRRAKLRKRRRGRIIQATSLPARSTMVAAKPTVSTAELAQIARTLRLHVVKMIAAANSGHPGGSLSAVDIITALYFGRVLKHDPKNPEWPDRDRFILSRRGTACRRCTRRSRRPATSPRAS